MITLLIFLGCLIAIVGAASFLGASLAVRERGDAFEEVMLRLQSLQAERQIHDITVDAYADMLDTARRPDTGGGR